MNESIKKQPLFILILVTLVAALYGLFLHNPASFDDIYFFMPDKNGQPVIGQYATSFSLLQLRSLPYASLAWTVQAFGMNVVGLRVGNLLLHAATVVALFVFLSSLFAALLSKESATRKDGLSLDWMAFFAALLFALHPVATYGTGYLVQRTIVMATLFSLLAMFAYVRGSVQKKQAWLWVSVLFYFLAVGSKEHAIMLPAVIVALTVLLHEKWIEELKRQWQLFAAYGVIALFVMLAKKGVLGSVVEVSAPEMLQSFNPEHAYLLSVLTQSWLFFKYWALWALPNPAWMSVDMREPFAGHFFSIYLLALMVFLLYGFLAIRLLFKRSLPGLLGFALLFPWLMFMTEMSSVRIQEIFVLYRSYLWAAGACALLPVIVWKITARGALVMLGVFALAMFPVSMERLSTFSHPLLLWDDAEKLVRGRSDLPGAYRIYYNRGTEFYNIDEYDKAISDLKRSIELYPEQAEAFGNLGAAYIKTMDHENAIRAYNQAIKLDEMKNAQPNPKNYYGRAIAYEAQKEWNAAIEDYKISCRLARNGCDKISLLQHETSPVRK